MFDEEHFHVLLERFDHVLRNQEAIMATIAGLATDVAALTTAVAQIPAPGTPPAVSVLSADDQTSLDASDASVQAATAAVSAAFPAPAPAEPVAPDAPAESAPADPAAA